MEAGFRVAAYATAGNRIISEDDDDASWVQFNRYIMPVHPGRTLHGTEEAKMEFIAVNFAHLGDRGFIESRFWHNMVSTGGASLQFGLVYTPDVHKEFVAFFDAVDDAFLQCNIERIIFDWVDVFVLKTVGGKMQFSSIEKQNHALARQNVARLIEKRQIEDPSEADKEFMSKMRTSLDTVYSIFLDKVVTVCAQAEGCFIGISFLGIIDAGGTCAASDMLKYGYHVIAGVDKFKSVLEIYLAEKLQIRTRIDPYATVVRDDSVADLIRLDPLLAPLIALVNANSRPFLPAGNWRTGIKFYDEGSRLMLPVYVNAMVQILHITMAYSFVVEDRVVEGHAVRVGVPTEETDQMGLSLKDRRTDWTYGAAWVMDVFDTCNFGPGAIDFTPFSLEQQSVSSLEAALSSFL